MSSIDISIFYSVFFGILSDRHMPEGVIRKTLGSLYPNNRFKVCLQFLVDIVTTGESSLKSRFEEVIFIFLLSVLYVSFYITEEWCLKIDCGFSLTLSL